VGYLEVFRNGVYLPNADYTATTGTTVVLSNAATAGDTITTISFYVSSVLNAIPATAGSVAASYLAGGAALSNISSGGITQTYLATGVAGTGPAFSAYQSTQQASLTSGVDTLLQFQTKEFDTGTCFNNTGSTATLNGLSVPAYAFMPNVAGYYQISGRAEVASSVAYMRLGIYRNGSAFKFLSNSNTATVTAINGSALIYFDGSTNYVQLYCQQGANQQLVNASANTYFQAAMVRSA
jgi:hypothetical protein